MALFYVCSMRFRPIHRQISLWSGKSRFLWSAINNECRGNPQALQANVCSYLSSKYKNPQVQSKHLYSSSASDNKTDVNKFNLIYKFPGIRMCKAITRLKLLQTTLTVTILPPLYYCYLHGQVTEDTVYYFTGIAAFAGVMLYSITYYLRRIIGMIYINQAETTLKVSHLTFWGKRKDIYIPIKDVKTLSETGDRKGEVIHQFRRYSCSDILYLTIRFGQVLDKEKFTFIFGKIK